MADYDTSPNFVNPAYATPEQLATQRAYAAELMKRSGQNVTRPAGALANMIDALTGSLERNRATQIQSQAAEANRSDVATMLSQMQRGGPVDPNVASRIIANPYSDPAHKELAMQRFRGERITSPYGEPAYTSQEGGTRPVPPLGPGYQPGAPVSEAAGGASRTAIQPAPIPATRPSMMSAPPPPVRTDIIPNRGGPPVNPNVPLRMPSQPVAAGTPIPVARPSIPNMPPSGQSVPPLSPSPNARVSDAFSQRGYGGSSLEDIARRGQAIGAETERVAGGAKAEAENIKTFVTNANSARQFGQDASTMEDLIRNNPNMPFGPWAKSSNEVQRIIANLPGGDKLMDPKTLAASDFVEKLNLSLAAAMQNRWGLNPSSIDLARGSTPGNEKSRQGTLDLLNVMRQGAKRDEVFATQIYPQLAQSGRLSEFGSALSKYYEANPLREPNTGHLIMQPVSIQKPQDEQRLGLKSGTPVKLPDGRVGWVP